MNIGKSYYGIVLLVVIIQAHSIFVANDLEGQIDRYSLVNRHHITLNAFDSLSPLSAGNGRFAFTVDLTGLQTFPDIYQAGIPLTTMSEWGWHKAPNINGYKYEDTFVEAGTSGRVSPLPIITGNPAADYFRSNPHQCNLARLGLILEKSDGTEAGPGDITDPVQTLCLWEGIIKSRFIADGMEVQVETFVHPSQDMVVVRVISDLITGDRLRISLRFPFARGPWGGDPSDWNSPGNHSTEIKADNPQYSKLLRYMDDFKYSCVMKYSQECSLIEKAGHTFEITPSGQSDTLQFCMLLSDHESNEPDVDLPGARTECQDYWKKFWSTGGAIDLSGSTDPRWKELERRIVLSEYLTAIQCAQKYPPAETGLTTLSWHGKFHLEMHWWHGIHFALWNRLEMLERSMGWYRESLPVARDMALRQGYEGARWPKMVGPDAVDSPSGIGPLLIWQQPHPIYYAELIYRQRSTPETLEQYKDIVLSSARFMASFASWNESRECFELGPPLISAREFSSNTYESNKNPTYELAYWSWGLKIANLWLERLGLPGDPQWERIACNMASWPVVDGVYIEQESQLVTDGGHPCMLGAFGMLPAARSLDRDIMLNTLDHVMKNWRWEDTWGWDYPMMAMTAARLGEGEMAVDALLKDVEKNTYLPNGHNYQSARLPLYLPGNGGLLTAVAMMAAGWDGCPESNAPGFPDNGRWVVKWEGLQKSPGSFQDNIDGK